MLRQRRLYLIRLERGITLDYWLHRVFSQEPELSVPLLERGILTIGYNDVSEQATINATTKDDLKAILQSCYGWTGGELDQRTGVLWRFLHEFKVGDFVVVPTSQSTAFGIFEILETAKPIDDLPPDKLSFLNASLVPSKGIVRNGKEIDLGFFIKVRAVTNYDSSPFVPCDNKFLFSILSSQGKLTNVSLN